ncbi:TcmI family type II polyketide cyclase [Streptomyces calidiresistens]|uniref:TcmI family type II polyketide cyclase n=1 Tax=Streptomyces calidiresistens TaxID=1485586 RepID=A0A7W3T313_9ACTN|nr:TcmI family type II polyketide cyclase [Streptomyces calidiresistens]MBB0230022.1 TcmI family type II polyketide cyclase [Streptomyces calidiresistens]
MSHRTLIVARMNHDDAEKVADIFAESDATELPHMIGVRRRTLFRFHGLYFHLVEAERGINENLYRSRSHPLYQDINTRLAQYMTPYDPAWREPKDSMAEPFYSWTP